MSRRQVETANERWERLIEQTRRVQARQPSVCTDAERYVGGIRKRLQIWGRPDDPAAAGVHWWAEEGLEPDWQGVPDQDELDRDHANDRYEALNRRNAENRRRYLAERGAPVRFAEVRGGLTAALRAAKQKRETAEA